MIRRPNANKFLMAGVCGLLIATAGCNHSLKTGKVPVVLHWIDANGDTDPDSSNVANVTGTAFKETTSGIIVQIGCGKVTNAYNHFVLITNQGVTVTDPEDTSTTYTATSDVEIFFGNGYAIDIAVYDPSGT